MQLQVWKVRSGGELDRAFTAIARERGAGIIILTSTTLFAYRARIAQLAVTHRLPTSGLGAGTHGGRLSGMPRVEVQTVAKALDIHPFMLSRWRKEVRAGVLRGRARRGALASRRARGIARLQVLEREHAMLREEHELLKKTIRFCSERRQKSSRCGSRSPLHAPRRAPAAPAKLHSLLQRRAAALGDRLLFACRL